MILTILFYQIELLYTLFSKLIYDLMLVLKLLCEQHSFINHEDCIQVYCIY